MILSRPSKDNIKNTSVNPDDVIIISSSSDTEHNDDVVCENCFCVLFMIIYVQRKLVSTESPNIPQPIDTDDIQMVCIYISVTVLLFVFIV